MHRRSLLVLALLVLVAVPVFGNHAWANYHWARTSNPFTVKIHDNLDSVWEPYLQQAVSDWNPSPIFDFQVLWGSPLTSQRKCGSTAGRVEICNEKYGQNGWLGIAGISISGSHITKGYTKLNDTYYAMPQYNTPAWRQLVTCQEIAHDIGLGHQDETFANVNLGSCMDYTDDPDGGAGGIVNNDPSNVAPNAHDFSMIASIYQHLDSTTTLSSVFDTMTDAALHVPSMEEQINGADEWGVPVRWDGQGRANLFIKVVGPNHGGGDHHDLVDGHLPGNLSYEIVDVFWLPTRIVDIDKPTPGKLK